MLRSIPQMVTSLLSVTTLAFSVSAEEDNRAVSKLAQGVAGMATGVLELPNQMVAEGSENGVLSGLTVGFAKGVGGVFTRSLVGFYQVVTAPFDGPAGLDTAMAYDYPWGAIEYALRGGDPEQTEFLAAREKELGYIRGIEIVRTDGMLRVRFPEELLFGFDSSGLNAQAEPRLTGLAETLVRHPDTRVLVQGFTDDTGNADYNVHLSEERAKAVREFLVQNGIDDQRVTAAGFGNASPIASNDSWDGRRKNRRVELVLLASDVAAER